ncbi:MAG: tetratricopeptide repeat protein [Chloroflexia bacterium]|nr:tetratricopeptide repeat protein [Chloroflexia bacterium]
MNRGIVYRRRNDLNASISNFNKAIELDKKLAAAYYFRGLDKITLKQKQDGCNDLKMAVDLGHPYALSQYRLYCLNNVKN